VKIDVWMKEDVYVEKRSIRGEEEEEGGLFNPMGIMTRNSDLHFWAVRRVTLRDHVMRARLFVTPRGITRTLFTVF
jgi:hypothetical protein